MRIQILIFAFKGLILFIHFLTFIATTVPCFWQELERQLWFSWIHMKEKAWMT